MKIKTYFDRLNNSSQFKEFKGKYPDAFMMAGFFILDLEQGNHMHQIDYYLPKEKKVAAFSLDDQVQLQLLELMKGSKTPEKLDTKTNVDLDALQGILEDEMKNRNISEEIKKIIAVVQTIQGKKVWNLNCVLSGMGLLRAHIDDESKMVLKMEKISMMDIIKHIPKDALKGMVQNQAVPSGKAVIEAKEDPEEEIKKLNQLEEKIKKEKQRLSNEINKKVAFNAEKKAAVARDAADNIKIIRRKV